MFKICKNSDTFNSSKSLEDIKKEYSKAIGCKRIKLAYKIQKLRS